MKHRGNSGLAGKLHFVVTIKRDGVKIQISQAV